MSNYEYPLWYREFEKLRESTDKSNVEIASIIASKYDITTEYARRKYYMLRNRDDDPEPDANIHGTILNLLKSEKTIEYLCDKLSISEGTLRSLIDDLKNQGYNVHIINDFVKYIRNVAPSYNHYTEEWDGDKIIRFGVLSDTHLCSKYQQITFLNELYDMYADDGINTVYHIGDLVDGYYKHRPDHIFELIPGYIGVDQQAEYVIDNYPKRKGVTTKFITGNHDQTHIRNGGCDIGVQIAKARSDMRYCGLSCASFDITPECKLETLHPIDGSAYALSYSIQKYLDSLSGGQKPNILLMGHHHKSFVLYYRNVHAIEAGCIQAQTPFMKGKKLSAHLGGYIYEAKVSEDGTIRRQKTEFIPQYTPIIDDF